MEENGAIINTVYAIIPTGRYSLAGVLRSIDWFEHIRDPLMNSIITAQQ